MKIFIATTLSIFFILQIASASAADCKAENWPKARDLKKQEFVKIFKHTKRPMLDSYLFHELNEPQKGPLAFYLLSYLKNSENNEDKEGFYALLEWGSELKDENSTSRKLEMSEICKYYEKAK